MSSSPSSLQVCLNFLFKIASYSVAQATPRHQGLQIAGAAGLGGVARLGAQQVDRILIHSWFSPFLLRVPAGLCLHLTKEERPSGYPKVRQRVSV